MRLLECVSIVFNLKRFHKIYSTYIPPKQSVRKDVSCLKNYNTHQLPIYYYAVL